MDKFFEFKTVTMTMCAIHYLTTEFARNTLWKVISATFQVTAIFNTANKWYPITGYLESLPNSQLALDPLRLSSVSSHLLLHRLKKFTEINY